MASQDFDIDSLAVFLHLTPQKVERLANRDKLPGRRVGGKWRFSRAEIHHWMEDRMGLLDDMELAKVETVLQEQDQQLPSIANLLSIDRIAIPLVARTKRSVIQSMANLAATGGLLWDPEAMASAIRDREEMCPTALDTGVALLHPRRPQTNILAEPLLALGKTDQGIPFGGSRGALTDIFFLICSTNDVEHLQILARLSRLLSNDAFLGNIRNAVDATGVYSIISTCEQGVETR